MKYFFAYISEKNQIETKLDTIKLKESLYNCILSKIRNSGIHNITTKKESVEFNAPIFRFVWNGFNLFNPISKGKVKLKIVEENLFLEYNFFFLEFFIYNLIFSTIPFISMLSDPVYKTLFLLIIWIIYFLSTMIAVHRFKNFIKKYIANLESQVIIKEN